MAILTHDRLPRHRSKLNKKPTNTDELIEAENFLQQVKNLEMPKLEREVQVVRGQVAFLFKHKNLHGDTLDSVNATFRQLNELKDQYERATNIVHAERMTFEASCRDSKKTLLAQMGKIEDLVGSITRPTSRARRKSIWRSSTRSPTRWRSSRSRSRPSTRRRTS